MAINGIFVLSELCGEAARIIREIQLEFDPKLARQRPHPHLTVAGSSGVGPILPGVPLKKLRDSLEPIAQSTPCMSLPFAAPHRFMQTNIIVLPLDPHGPIRELHDRIATSGLKFDKARFAFTPHVTLSFYPTHDSETLRRILAIRVEAPADLRSITVYHTRDPQPAKKLVQHDFNCGLKIEDRRS